MTTYYWDFFGPRAEGTARHFVAHLNQFLRQHGLEGCGTGQVSPRPNHVAAWCRSPPECCQRIQEALRPKRADTVDPAAAAEPPSPMP